MKSSFLNRDKRHLKKMLAMPMPGSQICFGKKLFTYSKTYVNRWDPNKAIDIRMWSICGGGRLERFYCMYTCIYICTYLLRIRALFQSMISELGIGPANSILGLAFWKRALHVCTTCVICTMCTQTNLFKSTDHGTDFKWSVQRGDWFSSQNISIGRFYCIIIGMVIYV